MKYILNESKKKTTNNYKINNISLDVDIPEIIKFGEYKIYNTLKIKKEVINDFNSKINLKHKKAYKISIDIDEDIKDILEYKIEKAFVGIIEINVKENTSSNLIIKYISEEEVFNNVKILVNTEENSFLNLTFINLLNNKSNNFIAIENNINNNSTIINNFIDLGSNIKISNINSILNENSSYTLNNMYIGSNNNIIDMNYNIDITKKNSKATINCEGLLKGESKKSFKGIIDFKKGSSKSVGKELENVLLLSDKAKSKSLPMLLCHEEDVIGSHGVSTGKIEQDEMFYLMSRGLNKKTVEKLIIDAKFNKILNQIPDKKVIDELHNVLDKIN